jgi:hypothetical protein
LGVIFAVVEQVGNFTFMACLNETQAQFGVFD